MTHEGRIINSHGRIFLRKCGISDRKDTSKDSHFSQNLPVKPSTHWHCCQDQRSKQVPPCLQGLTVQAPSSLGHLQGNKPQ